MEQQTQEWLDFRKNKIGASDAPIILNVSPWRTPYQLWQEKLSLAPPQKKTAAMDRGNDLEKEARLLFTCETGIQVEPKVIVSKEYEWMMASLDGVSQDNKTGVEIKCPGHDDHEMAINGNVPAKYIPQLQHQMKVMELDKIFYLSYFPSHDKEMILFSLERDEKYIQNLIEIEQEFWECVKKETPPKLSDRDYLERNDPEWLEKALQWKKLNQSIKELEKQEKQARETLIALAADNNISGGGVKVGKFVRKSNIDYSAIPELQTMDLEKYRKAPIEYWKLTG